MTHPTDRAELDAAREPGAASAPAPPLAGVKGWLKLFVVINVYVGPVLYVLTYLLAWVGFVALAENHPGVIFVGLIDTVVYGFLAVRWVQIGLRLRNIEPGAVQETRSWLKLTFGWNLVSAVLSFGTGLDAEFLVVDAVRQVILASVSFAIWYSYFGVSKRVRATYPDWNGR